MNVYIINLKFFGGFIEDIKNVLLFKDKEKSGYIFYLFIYFLLFM